MDTIPERSRTACSSTDAAKRLSRRNRFRKALDSALYSNTWQSEIPPQNIRENNSNYAIRDFSSDHNLKLLECKSSDDSAVDIDTTEINYPDYETNKLPRNFIYKTEDSSHHEDAVEFPVSCGVIPKSRIIAEEKLKRLKDLQRKREFNEFYYSQEIRKLISEYYKSSGNSGDSVIKKEKTTPSQGVMISPQTTSNLLKALEPCGTMTTITRLDCGCTQETTRPIFTTSNGRVESRNCSHGQNPVLLKLTSSNTPRGYLSSSNFIERRRIIDTDQNSPGLIKHRPPGVKDSRIIQVCRTPASATVNNSKRAVQQGARSTRCNFLEMDNSAINFRRPGTASSSFIRDNQKRRDLSPLRKYSDTSTD